MIGAHIGAVTTFLSDRFDNVVAFEAVPEIFAALERNVADLPNARAVHVGISDQPGQIYFEYAPGHTQLSHAHFDGEAPTLKGSVMVGPIQTVTINSFEFDRVSFMKIDVEGLELPVVEGARQTIERCRPVILIEQYGNEEKHHGRVRDEASHFLEVWECSGLIRFPSIRTACTDFECAHPYLLMPLELFARGGLYGCLR